LVLTLLKEMFVVIVTGCLWPSQHMLESKYA